MTRLFLALSLLLCPLGASAADIVVIGEVHDNPVHHENQARIVAGVAPVALVFEMLTPEQAGQVTPSSRGDEHALEAALGWNASGWPDFTHYYPIFAAAPEAAIFGAAVPRAQAREAMEQGPATVFGADAARFGLTEALPEAEQSAREALQMSAHCDALPETMLPAMVDIQRLRDVALARAALVAHEATGGPVVVITGNGHARRDWGMPAVLARVAPALTLRVIGQTEDGAPLSGGFDEILSAPTPERPDPCAAFR